MAWTTSTLWFTSKQDCAPFLAWLSLQLQQLGFMVDRPILRWVYQRTNVSGGHHIQSRATLDSHVLRTMSLGGPPVSWCSFPLWFIELIRVAVKMPPSPLLRRSWWLAGPEGNRFSSSIEAQSTSPTGEGMAPGGFDGETWCFRCIAPHPTSPVGGYDS